MPEILQEKAVSSTIVMAIGVGGGGGNAVNHLYTYGEKDIAYMLCNTDQQAMNNSPVPEKYRIKLGTGLGAGNDAEKGKEAAESSADKIKEALEESGVRMVFVIAGMGGGTGTGAAPVIARIAKELGILTIGVVTIPFEEEGFHRINQAIAGVDAFSKQVDSLIIINNTHIVDIYGDLPMSQAYYQSNDIISKAVKSISDIINKHFLVNVDFADVCKVMRNSGVALMGTGVASGENRALAATEQALTSPLLHNQDITGARSVLVCMISSQENETRMSDVQNVPAYIQRRTKTRNCTDVIWGAGYDNSLGDKMQVIVIATGFNVQNIPVMKDFYKKTLKAAEARKANSAEEKDRGPKVLDFEDGEVKDGRQNVVYVEDDDTFYSTGQKPAAVVKPAVDRDPDEPFVVTGSDDMDDESDDRSASPRLRMLDDDQPENIKPSGNPAVKSRPVVNEYPDDDIDDVSDDEEEVPKRKGFFSGVKKFFNGALVDKDDRH